MKNAGFQLLEVFCARRGAEAHSDLRRIMTDDYLTTVLEEAEHVAEQHDQVARTTDNQAHEYLRYAVLRMLEGQTDHLPADWTSIHGVTAGYGSDEAMFDRWGASGNRYEVDVIDKSCTCPDWQQRSPEGGCKHLRRVDHEIKRGRVPRPDGRLPSP